MEIDITLKVRRHRAICHVFKMPLYNLLITILVGLFIYLFIYGMFLYFFW